MKRSLITNLLLYSSTMAVVIAAMLIPLGLYIAVVILFDLGDSDLLLSGFIGVGLLAGVLLLRRKPLR
jgi:hypothetical protein